MIFCHTECSCFSERLVFVFTCPRGCSRFMKRNTRSDSPGVSNCVCHWVWLLVNPPPPHPHLLTMHFSSDANKCLFSLKDECVAGLALTVPVVPSLAHRQHLPLMLPPVYTLIGVMLSCFKWNHSGPPSVIWCLLSSLPLALCVSYCTPTCTKRTWNYYFRLTKVELLKCMCKPKPSWNRIKTPR